MRWTDVHCDSICAIRVDKWVELAICMDSLDFETSDTIDVTYFIEFWFEMGMNFGAFQCDDVIIFDVTRHSQQKR